MLKRTLNATVFNEIANRPNVRKHLNFPDGVEKLDLTDIFLNVDNYCLDLEFGGFICLYKEPGVYEIHTILDNTIKPKDYIVYVKEAMDYMFTSTPCELLTSYCDYDNKGAKNLALAAGMTMTANGATNLFSIDWSEWFLQTKNFDELGERFHKELPEDDVNHEDDPVHNRMVGVTAATIIAGETEKAVMHYNQWAEEAGYVSIDIQCLDPVVLDLEEFLLHIRSDGSFEVLH